MHTQANGEETCRLRSSEQKAGILMSDTPAQSNAEPRNQISRIIDRLRFCEDALRNGVPEEYFGWAGDQPSLGELAQSDAEPVADIDLAIDKVSMFRLERMDDGVIWIRLYRETGDDKVIWLNSSSAITATVDDDKARAALAQSDAELRDVQFATQNGARPIPFDRNTGGRIVREAWVRWAQTQPNPKPSWLVPYDELSEPDKEADRQIAQAVARWTLIHDAAALAQSDAEPDDNFERHLQARISKLEREVAELKPDTSAGLIEAAGIVKDWSRACSKDSEANLLDHLEEELRARTADRSGG